MRRFSLAIVVALTLGGLALIATPSGAATQTVSATLSSARTAIGERVLVRGRVTPKSPRQQVRLERYYGKKWHPYKVRHLTRNSTYTMGITMGRPGKYRFRVAAQRGVSKPFAVTTQPMAVTAGDASTIVQALASPSANVTGASFVSTTGGTPNGTSDNAVTEFPTDGSTFGILTTGDVNSVPNAGTFATTSNNGPNVRGDTDFDASILKVDLNVPSGANCLTFDFKFLSEEFPRFVNSVYNDAFLAELDNSTWTTSGSTISAPDNFAFDGTGEVVSINSTGIGGMSAAEGAATAFDGSGNNTDGAATTLLHASHQVTAGAHSLYLSIFDQGDTNLDSAAFLDNLTVGFVPNPAVNCVVGATPVTAVLDLSPTSASSPTGSPHSVTATLTSTAGAPIANATIGFAVTGANSATGTATTDASGVATFTYTGTNSGTDQIGACYDADSTPPCEAVGSATMEWTGVNHAPVADDQSVATNQDTPVGITLTASDADGDPLTYSVVSGPAHGTLSGTAPALTYTPAAGYSGPDSFTFKANDGKVDSNVAIVTIDVATTTVNSPPIADPQCTNTPRNTPVPITLTGSDPDGDALTYTIVTQPEHGTLSGTAPNLVYTPNADFTGSDSFTFTVNDGHVDSDPARVSIAVVKPHKPRHCHSEGDDDHGRDDDHHRKGDDDHDSCSFRHVDGKHHHLTIANHGHGRALVSAWLNGRRVSLGKLDPGLSRTYNLAHYMNKRFGNNVTVRLSAAHGAVDMTFHA